MGRGQPARRALPLEKPSLILSHEQAEFNEKLDNLMAERKLSGVRVGEPGPFVLQVKRKLREGVYEDAEWIYAPSLENALQTKLLIRQNSNVHVVPWQLDYRVSSASPINVTYYASFIPAEGAEWVHLDTRTERLREISQSVFGLKLENPQLDVGVRFAVFLDDGATISVRGLNHSEARRYLPQQPDGEFIFKGLYDLGLPLGSMRLPVTFSIIAKAFGNSGGEISRVSLRA